MANGTCVGCGGVATKGSDLCGACKRKEPEVRLLISQGKVLPLAPEWRKKLLEFDTSNTSSENPLPQCKGRTKKGERCKNPPLPGSEFCGFHHEEQKEEIPEKKEEESQEIRKKKEVPEKVADKVESLPNPRQFIYTFDDVLIGVGLSKGYDLTTFSLEELRQIKMLIKEEILPQIEERVKKLREIRFLLDEKIRVEIGREKKKLIDLKIPFGDAIGILLGGKESAGTKQITQNLLRQIDERIKPLEEAEKAELERKQEEERLSRPVTVCDLEQFRKKILEELQETIQELQAVKPRDISGLEIITGKLFQQLLQNKDFQKQIAQGIVQAIGPENLEAVKKALELTPKVVKITQG